jgi:hypothetical protein
MGVLWLAAPYRDDDPHERQHRHPDEPDGKDEEAAPE